MRQVIVTTDRRGVFAGTLNSEPETSDELTLADARMVVRWRNVRGLLGLANDGPNDQCRITRPVPSIRLFGITSIIEMTPEAVEKLAEQPWAQ